METGPRTSGVYHKHGYSHTRIDNIYKTMIGRCFNPKCKSYPRYGAKGITVCEEWKTNKIKFFEWAFSHGYKEDLTIDRIDPSKGYSPENCRWADYITQNNHRNTNCYVTVDGVTHTVAEWSRITGIKAGTIQQRLYKGWNPKEAVYTPTIDPAVAAKKHYITVDGETHSLTEWEQIKGLTPGAINSRLKMGWDELKAVTTPIQKRGSWSKKGA